MIFAAKGIVQEQPLDGKEQCILWVRTGEEFWSWGKYKIANEGLLKVAKDGLAHAGMDQQTTVSRLLARCIQCLLVPACRRDLQGHRGHFWWSAEFALCRKFDWTLWTLRSGALARRAKTCHCGQSMRNGYRWGMGHDIQYAHIVFTNENQLTWQLTLHSTYSEVQTGKPFALIEGCARHRSFRNLVGVACIVFPQEVVLCMWLEA